MVDYREVVCPGEVVVMWGEEVCGTDQSRRGDSGGHNEKQGSSVATRGGGRQGLHRPSRHMVEKKAMLRVSRGLSCVHSGERVCGSDSPVSEELSTLQPWADRMRMSAGTRSPPFISTRSPTTS